jgi:DNA-binding MarR family transcriptional regulator
MLTYDFEQSLGYWVCSTAHALRKSLDAKLAQDGITFRQWEVLAMISIHGEQTQRELGDRMGIEAPTLAGILDRMERDGVLERVPCSEDRRCKRIRATDKAEMLWERGVECAHETREQAAAGLSEEELAQFKELCSKIRHNLNGDKEVSIAAAICGEAPSS